jgi:hypothetical protein
MVDVRWKMGDVGQGFSLAINNVFMIGNEG